MTAIFQISMIDANGEWKMLQGFTGPATETYAKADKRLDHWQNKYPHAIVEILRKA